MKKEIYFSLLFIVILFKTTFQQDVNSLIKQKLKLDKEIKKFDEIVKNYTEYTKKVERDKLMFEKDLQTLTAEYEEENLRFILFGMFSEESGLKYLRKFNQNMEKLKNPYSLFDQKKEFQKSFEILDDNIQNRYKNIQRLIGNIYSLDKSNKTENYNKLIYMIRQANYLNKQDNLLKNKVVLLENELKKSKISTQLYHNNNFLHTSNKFLVEPKCVNRDSCRVCLEDPSCVWCDSDKECKFGDENGPYDGSCTNNFRYSFCEKSCFAYTTCTKCIEDESCGWCGELNKCIEGNYMSSIGILCETGYIHKENQGRCSNHFLNNRFKSVKN